MIDKSVSEVCSSKHWHLNYTIVLHNVQNVMNNEVAALMNNE